MAPPKHLQRQQLSLQLLLRALLTQLFTSIVEKLGVELCEEGVYGASKSKDTLGRDGRNQGRGLKRDFSREARNRASAACT